MRISDWSSDVCSSDLVDDEESVNQAPISDDFKPRISAYDLLMRQSRKMGGLATRTYDVTKEFLKQDVSVLHPDRELFGSRATRQKARLNRIREPEYRVGENQNGNDLRTKEGEIGSNSKEARSVGKKGVGRDRNG